jgi:molybdenum cofactor cytidylyltransferase
MQLEQAFRISNSACVALSGSGGKTTALFQLARRLSTVEEPSGATAPGRAGGRMVIVSATTHLHVNQIQLADAHWIGETPQDFSSLEDNLTGVMLVTGPLDGDRTTGLDNPTISWLHEFCKSHGLPFLIEADGSRQRPLKAPAEWEPPIPDFVETVAVVAGLSGLGHPLTDEFVHRPGVFARLSSLAMGETISPEALLRVLAHPSGGLKNIPAQARRLVMLNQADTAEIQAQAKALAGNLIPSYDAVIIASLAESMIHAVYEPVAGIILAAGEARRFGESKQLLDYHGQPFIRAVAKTALASGLSPVVVVTGANAEAVEAAVSDLPVALARNSGWQNGQSSSIRSGLQALRNPLKQNSSPKFREFGGGRDGVGAAIFLLADQPQLTPTVLRALTEQHAQTLAPIVAPLVAGRRANPVLFDQATFPDLLSLTGDVGGRAIFSKYPVAYLPWQDESLLMDVDTPEDLERLRKWQ